ncbi:DEAD/DEAH box helicase family protein [Streptomyces sp. NPDC058683]|uniref:DEAD/DEAH box helicase family protein n=1 Tax=Streptomyces sp. NPDC058683 TaxID=3346597 RepID=UPI00364957C3
MRACQDEALAALANYYASGGRHAATVMAVGAGKTALGVAAALSFSRRRALVVTPGSVIRGTFAKALDPGTPGNVLYGLAGGPLLPGTRPPATLVLDRDDGQTSRVIAASWSVCSASNSQSTRNSAWITRPYALDCASTDPTLMDSARSRSASVTGRISRM